MHRYAAALTATLTSVLAAGLLATPASPLAPAPAAVADAPAPAARETFGLIQIQDASRTHRVRRGVVRVVVGCDAAVDRCDGNVQLRRRGRDVTTRSASVDLVPGETATLEMRVKRSGRQLLPKGRAVRLQVVKYSRTLGDVVEDQRLRVRR